MRKDFAVVSGSEADETRFVEDYWTKVWDTINEKAKRASNIETTEEYAVMRPFLDAVRAGARIVDGGCGLGEYVLHFHEKGFDSLGIDLSKRTVEMLRQRFPGVAFMAGDIRTLDLPSSSVDVYFSWGVFEHFEAGPGACITEGFRILKPGGLLFVTVPYDNVRHSLRGLFERPTPHVSGTRFYQWRFTRAELGRELAVVGFEVEKMAGISKKEGLKRFLHHDLRMGIDWIATRGIARGLSPVLPSGLIAHMLMAVARKPEAE